MQLLPRQRQERTLLSELAALMTDYGLPLLTPVQLEHQGQLATFDDDHVRAFALDLYRVTYEFATTAPVSVPPPLATPGRSGASPLFGLVGRMTPGQDNASSVGMATPRDDVFDETVDGSDTESDEPNRSRTTVEVKNERDDEGFETVNQYVILHRIARGGQAEVLKAMDQERNRYVAIKARARPPSFQEATCKEVHLAKQLSHENIVRVYEIIDDPHHKVVFIVMQFVEGGPVFTLDEASGTCAIQPLERICSILTDTSKALRYLHRRGVVHKDVKPANVLYDTATGRSLLTDFGISDELGSNPTEESSSQQEMGTVPFLAPEIFRGEPYSEASDMWALGVMLFAMIHGRLPFQAPTYIGMRDLVYRGVPKLEVPRDYALVEPFLRRLLNPDPKLRITSKQLRDAGLTDQIMAMSGTSDTGFAPYVPGTSSPAFTPIYPGSHP